MKKQFFTAVIAITVMLMGFAEEKAPSSIPVNLKKWTTVEGKLQKELRKYVQFDEKELRLTSGERPVGFGYFGIEPIPCKVADKVKIRLEVSGTGILNVGFLEYKSGYTYTGTLTREIRLVSRPVPYELVFKIDAADTTLARPVIFVSAKTDAVIRNLSIEK